MLSNLLILTFRLRCSERLKITRVKSVVSGSAGNWDRQNRTLDLFDQLLGEQNSLRYTHKPNDGKRIRICYVDISMLDLISKSMVWLGSIFYTTNLAAIMLYY